MNLPSAFFDGSATPRTMMQWEIAHGVSWYGVRKKYELRQGARLWLDILLVVLVLVMFLHAVWPAVVSTYSIVFAVCLVAIPLFILVVNSTKSDLDKRFLVDSECLKMVFPDSLEATSLDELKQRAAKRMVGSCIQAMIVQEEDANSIEAHRSKEHVRLVHYTLRKFDLVEDDSQIYWEQAVVKRAGVKTQESSLPSQDKGA